MGREAPPDGVINLYSVTDIAPMDTTTGLFKISTPDQAYVLRAADRNGLELWVKYLRNARLYFHSQKEILSSAPIGSKSDMEQCGYLEKLGRFNKWKCRWFALRDGVLFRYSDRVRNANFLII